MSTHKKKHPQALWEITRRAPGKGEIRGAASEVAAQFYSDEKERRAFAEWLRKEYRLQGKAGTLPTEDPNIGEKAAAIRRTYEKLNRNLDRIRQEEASAEEEAARRGIDLTGNLEERMAEYHRRKSDLSAKTSGNPDLIARQFMQSTPDVEEAVRLYREAVAEEKMLDEEFEVVSAYMNARRVLDGYAKRPAGGDERNEVGDESDKTGDERLSDGDK